MPTIPPSPIHRDSAVCSMPRSLRTGRARTRSTCRPRRSWTASSARRARSARASRLESTRSRRWRFPAVPGAAAPAHQPGSTRGGAGSGRPRDTATPPPLPPIAVARSPGGRTAGRAARLGRSRDATPVSRRIHRRSGPVAARRPPRRGADHRDRQGAGRRRCRARRRGDRDRRLDTEPQSWRAGPAGRHHFGAARVTRGRVRARAAASAHGFDIFDTTGQDQNENDNEAPRAIDGNPRTAWHTLFYEGNPVFGGLKKGTGLILDMGKPVKLATSRSRSARPPVPMSR